MNCDGVKVFLNPLIAYHSASSTLIFNDFNKGDFMQTVVKNWFRNKDSGFLDNGNGPDIMVRKSDIVNCQFLKIGAAVEFECHIDKQGLTAKRVKLLRQNKFKNPTKRNPGDKKFPFGVMT